MKTKDHSLKGSWSLGQQVSCNYLAELKDVGCTDNKKKIDSTYEKICPRQER